MNKKMLKRVLAFVLMAAVMVGLVFFRSENNYDKHYFRAKLARGQEVHCRIDLGKGGRAENICCSLISIPYITPAAGG